MSNLRRTVSAMNVGRDTIRSSDWIAESSIIPASRKRRELLLRKLTESNGYSDIESLLKDILLDQVSPYAVSRFLIGSLRKKDFAPLTIAEYRSMLPDFFESVLGENNFSRKTFDRLVKAGDMYAQTSKRIPTIEELKKMLLLANPRNRALLGFLSCTGCRISEALSRRMSDIQEKKGYAIVNFQARSTKSRTKRYAFITQEVLDWIRESCKGVKSEYVFPGKGTVGPTHIGWKPSGKDKPLSRNAADIALYEMFRKAELKVNEDERFSAHSLRTFADSHMMKCGLDRKAIALIISHKSRLAAESHYVDWEVIEQEWRDKCLDYFTWRIHEPTYQIVRELPPEAQKRLSRLEKLLALMVRRYRELPPEEHGDLPEEVEDFVDNEKLIEDKSEEH